MLLNSPKQKDPVAVLGATGQLGRALVDLLGAQALPLARPAFDLAQPEALLASLREQGALSAVINASAYTQVDAAESDLEGASRINVRAPELIARFCAEQGIPLVHYSTDYVFDGSGSRPWREDDPTAPLNVYGRTKLAGEKAILASGARALIFRTSWVYDALGKNFFRTMLRLGAEREVLKVVADQIGAPTYAPHLAKATLEALEAARATAEPLYGLYHLCNQGETSWHGFAQAIFESARALGLPLQVKMVEAIPSVSYPTPAKRPLNSRLDTTRARNNLGVHLPHWQIGLRDCFAVYQKGSAK